MNFTGRDGKDAIIDRFSRYCSSGKAEFFQSVGIDFCFGRREGPYVWDTDGSKRLINCHCNGGVFNLGHRHPLVTETLIRSLKELDIGNHHLISEQRALLAEKLARLTPVDMQYTVFGVGGGEAIDLAIKLARGYTGRQRIISAQGGYHGHTGLALATGDEQYRAPFGPPLSGFLQIPFGDIVALDESLDTDTAAVIFETVPATLGMPIAPAGFFREVQNLCRRNGVLFILDEVQTGLGRTGRLWGIDHFEVVPDIMVIGKGLSGGIYPITATCFRPQYESFFHEHPFIHVSTFGGAEVGCPVAMAVLEESSRPEFLAHVNKLADIFASGFVDLKAKHPEILVGLRQLGLMMGIEMVNELCGPIMSKTCYDHGILSIYANNDKRISQLLPPLMIEEVVAYEILEGIDGALADAKKLLNL
ncbi:MAG: aminotransferase class III-fold pyridoxal phosphate-dependent enzyme [Smithellaceae bacterium]|nr:aminotransferase class III-fold pyridoxal phosphate-dependent enzyme [Smithellaceae bacterium]